MPDPITTATPNTADDAWQRRLLPFMAGMLAVLTIFFCGAIAWGTYHIQSSVENGHEIDLRAPATGEFGSNPAFLLEANLIERRYHQTSAAMVSRVYLIFLGFATGMVLAMVGATFVLGKMREADTSIDGAGGSVKASLKSGSPGLILAAFGTTLMLCTIFSRADISVTDQAVYLGQSSANAAEHPGNAAIAKSQSPAERAGLHALMSPGTVETDGDYALDDNGPGTLSIRGTQASYLGHDLKKKAVDLKIAGRHIAFTIHESDQGREEFDGYQTSDGDIAGTHTFHGTFTTSPSGFVAKKIRIQ